MFYFYYSTFAEDIVWWLLVEFVGTLTMSTFGLAAVWVALGKAHWFCRTAVLAVWIGAWTFVPAYDICFVALVQSSFIVFVLLLWRYLQQRSSCHRPTDGGSATQHHGQRYQFRVSDLLLAMALAASLCMLLTHVPVDSWRMWPRILCCGVGYGVAILMAVFSALGRRMRWLRLALVCLVPYAIPVAAWLAVWRRWNAEAVSSSRRRRWAVALTLATVCLVTFPVWVYASLIYKAPIPDEPIVEAESSAYLQLIDAGRMVDPPIYARRYARWDQAWLVPTVKTIAPALAKARQACQQPCHVPIYYDLPVEGCVLFLETSPFKALGYAFLAESRLAILDGKRVDALASLQDGLRLVRCTSAGGLINHTLHAGITERNVLREVYHLRPEMTSKEIRHWIRMLEEQERTIEPLSYLWKRTHAYVDRTFGWRGKLAMRFDSRRFKWEHNFSYSYTSAVRRMLMCELALRLYSIDHGTLPTELEQLVPDYLPEVPSDPFADASLVYRRSGDGYLLYSVGSDRIDNGGAEPPGGTTRLFVPGDYRSDFVFRRR